MPSNLVVSPPSRGRLPGHEPHVGSEVDVNLPHEESEPPPTTQCLNYYVGIMRNGAWAID